MIVCCNIAVILIKYPFLCICAKQLHKRDVIYLPMEMSYIMQMVYSKKIARTFLAGSPPHTSCLFSADICLQKIEILFL
jgi:hypothetical protein